MIYKTLKDATLLDSLIKLSPQSSKSTLRSWLKEGRVTIDDKTTKIANTPVQKGQTIKVAKKPNLTPEGIQILYEDKHLVVIEKPEGLLSVAAAFEQGKTAHQFLKERYRPNRVYVVHRLDRETSGLMLFALSEEARDLLKKSFEKHQVKRIYCAIVEGKVQLSNGTWTSYLWEDEGYTVHFSSDPNRGQLAITHYKVLNTSKRYSWLEVQLETGKKNQIRVHCQQAGHSVVGDKKYGAQSNPIKRLCLHAHTLHFDHPITGKKMSFTSTLPESFQRLQNHHA